MTEDLERLHLATRLHGATMPVLELMLTANGSPTIEQLHTMCSVAERVERAGDMGPDDELFLAMLQQLMQTTEAVREYVDARRKS